MANQQGNITAGTTETGNQGNTVPGNQKLSGDEATRKLGENQQQRKPTKEQEGEGLQIDEEHEDMNVKSRNPDRINRH